VGKVVIVTGASGFTGYYVVKELLKNGFDIVATYLKNKSNNDDNEIRWCQVDLTDKDSCLKLIKSVEPYAIIHLAAQNNIILSKDFPEETLRINNNSVINILESVRLYSPKTKCILAGSAAVYRVMGDKEKLTEDSEIGFENAYMLSKIYQEQLAKLYQKFGLKIICTRPFNYTGCYQRNDTFVSSMCHQISDMVNNKALTSIKVGNIDVFRDFSDVRDVARAYHLLLDEDVQSGIYNISSGTAVLLRDIVEYLCGKVNREIQIITDTSLLRKNETLYICGDNSFIKNKTGWSNIYTIYDTLDWMCDYSMGMMKI
jgi:GDP-4-dehydro-6-deoxy-D-mannose reductase